MILLRLAVFLDDSELASNQILRVGRIIILLPLKPFLSAAWLITSVA